MHLEPNLNVRTKWVEGTAADSVGPFFISYTEFTPDKPHDVLGIYLASRRLVAACAGLEGAVGLTTYWQLRHWRGGSLSVWDDPGALHSFVRLPYHVEIMRKYRMRGTVRSSEWWSESFDLAQALTDGRHALDGSL
ncbi:MAG TPA: hypothetical protein VFP23_06195 [Solirubrobacterales bacterium]|nr:hypothetical protein [Solirubrobacterales bacterium]